MCKDMVFNQEVNKNALLTHKSISNDENCIDRCLHKYSNKILSFSVSKHQIIF